MNENIIEFVRENFNAEIEYEILCEEGLIHDTLIANADYLFPCSGKEYIYDVYVPLYYHSNTGRFNDMDTSEINRDNGYMDDANLKYALSPTSLIKVILSDIVDLYPTMQSFSIKSKKIQHSKYFNEWKMKFKMKIGEEETDLPVTVKQNYYHDHANYSIPGKEEYYSEFAVINDNDNSVIGTKCIYEYQWQYLNDKSHFRPDDIFILNIAMTCIEDKYNKVKVCKDSYVVDFSLSLDGEVQYNDNKQNCEDYQ